ncbi:hypothetical protein ACFTAO_19735 [Paenibacillus rhizoplanae]
MLVPGRSSAAGKVIEQLPEPEWSYTLPEGHTFWGHHRQLTEQQAVIRSNGQDSHRLTGQDEVFRYAVRIH